MGTNQSKEVPQASPLGCILTHWKEVASRGGSEKKKDFIQYCMRWWPLYRLEDGVKWPHAGTLDYTTLLQLMLFLRWKGKWDEVSYTDMFSTLLNHLEWQRNCGLRAPLDPLVLALEKETKAKKGQIKQCCS